MSTWNWATVTGVNPLRVRLYRDIDSLLYTPAAIGDTSRLQVGDQVWYLHDGARVMLFTGSGDSGGTGPQGTAIAAIQQSTMGTAPNAGSYQTVGSAFAVSIPDPGTYRIVAYLSTRVEVNAAWHIQLLDGATALTFAGLTDDYYHSNGGRLDGECTIERIVTYKTAGPHSYQLRMSVDSGSGTGVQWLYPRLFVTAVGPVGPPGKDGDQGPAGTIMSATASPLAASQAPTVTLGGTPEARTVAFGIPAGGKGDPGLDGTPAGFGAFTASATALPVGATPTAAVTKGGTNTALTAAFAFGIPPGDRGAAGPAGSGIWSTASQLGTGATSGVVPVAVAGRTPQIGDLVVSSHASSPGAYGSITAVASAASVTVAYIGSIRGAPGTDAIGTQGPAGYTVVLSSESWVFPAGVSAAIASTATITVSASQAGTAVTPTIGTITGQVTGLTTAVSGTTITVTAATTLTTKSGVLTIPVTVGGVVYQMKWSWALALTGAKGDPGSVDALATMNNGWFEERLGGDWYRWTQLFSVTAATSVARGGGYITAASLPLPPKPIGATIVGVPVDSAAGGYVVIPNSNGPDQWTVTLFSPQAQPAATYLLRATAYGTKP